MSTSTYLAPTAPADRHVTGRTGGCTSCAELRQQVEELNAVVDAFRLRGGPLGPVDAGGGPPTSSVPVSLSPRELAVLALIVQGKRNAEIARDLFLSVNTIKSHTNAAYRKIGVTNRTEAAVWFLGLPRD